MTTANIEKVIARKTRKKEGWTKAQILEVLKAELIKNAEKLTKVFPTVIIDSFGDEELLNVSFGVSYRPETWTTGKAHVSDSTQNIALKTYGDTCIYTGYGANSARQGYNGKTIPYSNTMTKPQLKKVFKEAIEQLVSCAYYEHADFYKQDVKVSSLWVDGVKTEIKH